MRAVLFVPAVVIVLAATALGADLKFARSGPESSAALQGLRQRIAEFNIQGKFLRVRLTLALSSDGPMPGEALSVFAGQRGRIADLAGRAGGSAVFNLSDDSDSLRAACLAKTPHVIPSARMKAAAVSQWKARKPNAPLTAAA